MLYSLNELTNYFFFDAEVISQYPTLEQAPESHRNLWMKKHHLKCLEKEIQRIKDKAVLANAEEYLTTSDIKLEDFENFPTPNEIYIRYAPLYKEFSKVLCIAVGAIDKDRNIENVVIHDQDEKILLTELSSYFKQFPKQSLAGFNIKGYDIPMLITRMLILGVPLPYQLQLRGKKPWEITTLDLAEDWKGLNFTMSSLETVCMALSIPSSKDEFDGGDMGPLYQSGQITIEQVKNYCLKDNDRNMQVALKLCS